MHGERANFTWLVLGCIEADFCNQILVGIGEALADIYAIHSVLQLQYLKTKNYVKSLCAEISRNVANIFLNVILFAELSRVLTKQILKPEFAEFCRN